jgi:uncharacterized membrane protein
MLGATTAQQLELAEVGCTAPRASWAVVGRLEAFAVLLLGPDDVHDRVDQSQMGERLREVAEVASRRRVDLLGVELQGAGEGQ